MGSSWPKNDAETDCVAMVVALHPRRSYGGLPYACAALTIGLRWRVEQPADNNKNAHRALLRPEDAAP